MKRTFLLAGVLLCAAAAVLFSQARRGATAAPAASTDVALRARVTAFLSRTLGWQGLDKMDIESISAPDASGLRTVKVLLAKGDQHQEGTYFITADEKEIIEGAKSSLSADPWAETRSEIETAGAPSEGLATAPVTVVEYSDLECPYCKEEAANIQQLLQSDPGKFRVVFKFYPLVDIHPWAMQAAKEAYCVAQQHPEQFWTFANTVFGQQDNITPTNAATRLDDFATESGAQPGPLHACVTSPATASAIAASIANGKKIGVESTPTLYVNGREIPGAVDAATLKLLVDHEAGYAVHNATELSTGAPKGQQCGECKVLPPIKH